MGEPLDPIPAVAPSPSILTSARPIPDVDWSQGVSWSPACVPSFAWPRCPEPDTEKEAAQTPGPLTDTEPFVIYTALRCDWVLDGNIVAGPASALTDAHTAGKLARALWMGDALPAGHLTLRNAASDVSIGGAPAELDDAVAVLLANYEQCTDGEGGAVLHVPSIVIPAALGGSDGGARIAWPEGNFYRGPLGSLVSPGPLYPWGFSDAGEGGYGPITDTGPPEEYQGSDGDEVWVYVSGPVEYAVSPIKVLPEAEAERRALRANRYEVMGERLAIFRFDPCCVFAARVTAPQGWIS